MAFLISDSAPGRLGGRRYPAFGNDIPVFVFLQIIVAALIAIAIVWVARGHWGRCEASWPGLTWSSPAMTENKNLGPYHSELYKRPVFSSIKQKSMLYIQLGGFRVGSPGREAGQMRRGYDLMPIAAEVETDTEFFDSTAVTH